MPFEKPITIAELAARTGLSQEWLRSAVHRGRGMHPLPCVWFGAKRPVCRVRFSTFEAWYAEEERIA